MEGGKIMYDFKRQNVLYQADIFIQRATTIREVAKYLKISKSALHYNLTTLLLDYDINRYQKVRKILDKNIAERHIRGGIATRNKILMK